MEFDLNGLSTLDKLCIIAMHCKVGVLSKEVVDELLEVGVGRE